MNMTVTNVDLGGLIIGGDPVYADETVNFASALTYKAGTILARHSGTGKLIPYVVGGSSNENGIPKAVLEYEVVSTGAEDQTHRPIMGNVTLRKDKLVVHADGDDSNIDVVVLDLLRDYGFYTQEVEQLAHLDNQETA